MEDAKRGIVVNGTSVTEQLKNGRREKRNCGMTRRLTKLRVGILLGFAEGKMGRGAFCHPPAASCTSGVCRLLLTDE